jgi:hypothetical protein
MLALTPWQIGDVVENCFELDEVANSAKGERRAEGKKKSFGAPQVRGS